MAGFLRRFAWIEVYKEDADVRLSGVDNTHGVILHFLLIGSRRQWVDVPKT